MLFFYTANFFFYFAKHLHAFTNTKNYSLFDVINNVNAYINLGNIKEAGIIYNEYFEKYQKDPDFQKSYLEYLIKIGDYDMITTFKSNESFINNKIVLDIIKDAEQYIKWVKDINADGIFELFKKSNYSVTITLLAAELYLNKGMNHNCIVALQRGEDLLNKEADLKKNSNELVEKYYTIYGRYYFLMKDYNKGIKMFNNVSSLQNMAQDFQKLYNNFLQIQKNSRFFDIQKKLKELNTIYLNVVKLKVLDNFVPSVYKELEVDILTFYVKEAVLNKHKGCYLMGKKLIELVENAETFELFLSCMIIEKKSSIMIKKFLDYAITKVVFNQNSINYFKNNIKKIEADELAEAEKKKQSERENYRKQSYNNRTRNGFGGNQESPQKGDFLEYYKILGVENTKVSTKEISKYHRRAVRKANKIKDEAERNEKLIKINKAADILSDEKTKATYDMGIDPDNQYSGYDNSNQYYQSGGFGFNNDDVNDIFATFFGGTRGSRTRGNTGYFRSNGRTFSFSTGF